MTKTPLELAHTMLACIDAGDWAGVMAITAPDYVVHEPPELPFGGSWRGQDALLRLFPRELLRRITTKTLDEFYDRETAAAH